MKHQETNEFRRYVPEMIPAAVVLLILGAVIAFLFFRINGLENQLALVKSDLASSTSNFYKTSGILAQNLIDLRSQTTGISSNLEQSIASVRDQVGGVEQTLGSVTGSVSTLQKLVQTDPELLKKYSKVFFLNENYTPAHLTIIPQEYDYSSNRQEQFLTESWGYLKAMLDAAKAAGVDLYVKSAYRSFLEQQSLKTAYTVTYGAGTANSFSADQGYSEHQLGTTVDLITSGMGGQLVNSFDKSLAYKWLKDNAYKYGFEMSYPKDNAYYVYEPWHWRFVGVKLATYLYNQHVNFYDMDQRAIDTYLADLFS